eukprot:m.360188 g.360188  ORF g.360188 m.360188 type:complete len:172 (+) comp20767_c0_seq32:1094-1609(+)
MVVIVARRLSAECTRDRAFYRRQCASNRKRANQSGVNGSSIATEQADVVSTTTGKRSVGRGTTWYICCCQRFVGQTASCTRAQHQLCKDTGACSGNTAQGSCFFELVVSTMRESLVHTSLSACCDMHCFFLLHHIYPRGKMVAYFSSPLQHACTTRKVARKEVENTVLAVD